MKRLIIPIILIFLLTACSGKAPSYKKVENKTKNNSTAQKPKSTDNNKPKEEITITLPGSEPGETTKKKVNTQLTPEAVIKALMDSSGSKGTADLFPKGTKLLGVKIKGDVAYINFNDSVRQNPGVGGEGEAAFLNSLINSLTQLKGIKAIQLEANSVVLEELWGHYDLSEPLKAGDVE